MNPSTALARVLVDELVANRVTDVVLAPGSRNAPLSLALHDADAAGRLRLHVRIDERTAGFLALGLARGSGTPVAVCTTSGSAVAHLHGAVLEAHHGGVPLLLLTADRPPQLRDVGANQTVDQHGLFGAVLRFFHEFGVPVPAAGQQAGWRALTCRALARARGTGAGRPGPVQLNLPLAEPLLPDGDPDWPEPLDGRGGPWTGIGEAAPDRDGLDALLAEPGIAAPEPGEKVLYLADFTHSAAAALAARGQLVLSEAGGAAGSQVLSAGIQILSQPGFLAGSRPDRVVVLGRPTLFRPVTALLADPRIVVDVVAPPADYADPTGRARRVASRLAPPAGPGDPVFAARWREADAAAAGAVRRTLAGFDLAASPRLAADVVAALPSGSTLVVGSSQSPRDVGLAAAPRDGVRLLANRGVAGIDGTVSTAIGAALSAPAGAPPTVALLGDLALLHDLTGLVIGPHEPRPDLVLVVANNDGGGIFATLEPGAPAHARAFERVFGTPHGALLGGAVEALGAEHQLVTEPDQLVAALRDPAGIRVVEVPVSRTELAGQHAALRAAVAGALTV